MPTSKSLQDSSLSLPSLPRAYLEPILPTLPNRKPLEYNLLSRPIRPRAYRAKGKVIGIHRLTRPSQPRAHLVNQQIFEPAEPTSGLAQTKHADQQIIGIHCLESTEWTKSLELNALSYQADLEPTLPASISLEYNVFVEPSLARAYLEPTSPTSKALEYIALSSPSRPQTSLANQQIIK